MPCDLSVLLSLHWQCHFAFCLEYPPISQCQIGLLGGSFQYHELANAAACRRGRKVLILLYNRLTKKSKTEHSRKGFRFQVRHTASAIKAIKAANQLRDLPRLQKPKTDLLLSNIDSCRKFCPIPFNCLRYAHDMVCM